MARLRTIAHFFRRFMEHTLRFGAVDLRRVTPLYTQFGYHRGTPVDRYYIEQFLKANIAAIRGDGVEVAEDKYLSQFESAALRSKTSLVLSGPGPSRLVGDLTNTATLPENQFDCFICTQTLNFIYDFREALRGCRHLLKPNGHLLVTVAGISQRSEYDATRWGDFWRFTPQSLARMASEEFGVNVSVATYGNVLSATALLHGIVAEELTPEELDPCDPNYPVIVCLLASKTDALI